MKTKDSYLFPNAVITLTSITEYEGLFENRLAPPLQQETEGSSCWWLVFCKLGYYLRIFPFKIVQRNEIGSRVFHIHVSKAQLAISWFMTLSCLAYFVWKLELLLSCKLEDKVYLRLIDQLPDLCKLFAITYISLARQGQIVQVINSGIKYLPSKTNATKRVKNLRELNKTKLSAWLILGGYVLYTVVSKLVGDLISTRGFISLDFATLRATHDTHCRDGAANETTLRKAIFVSMLFPQQFHMFFVHLADLLLVATVGMYCEMVDQIITKLRALTEDDREVETHSKLAFQTIAEFQDQLGRINSCVEDILLFCMLSDLPYYVLRAIPSIFFTNTFTHVKLRRSIYVTGYFGSLLAAGFKYEKLQDAIRHWISKASVLKGANPKHFQQLVWDLESNRNFAIGLNGFGHFDISLFKSIVSIMLTYTVIYYQFQKPEN